MAEYQQTEQGEEVRTQDMARAWTILQPEPMRVRDWETCSSFLETEMKAKPKRGNYRHPHSKTLNISK